MVSTMPAWVLHRAITPSPSPLDPIYVSIALANFQQTAVESLSSSYSGHSPSTHQSRGKSASKSDPRFASHRDSRVSLGDAASRASRGDPWEGASHHSQMDSRDISHRDHRSVYSQEYDGNPPITTRRSRTRAETLRDDFLNDNGSVCSSEYSGRGGGSVYQSMGGHSSAHSIAALEAELKELKIRENAERKYEQRMAAAEREYRYAIDREFRDVRPKPKKWVGEYKGDLA